MLHLAAAHSVAAEALNLHVPSPEWRDQVIYFAMIDRFDDGDPGNDALGADEFDRSDGRKYSGGDLAGLIRRLDYIRGLGATALWITPPVAHQWWDGQADYGGYHGYWGADFKSVDAHFGTLDDYRRLSHALHQRGMYLVQDIVVNHVGNFFAYPDGHDPARPQAGYRANTQSQPMAAPTQPPFDRNDARKRNHRRAGIYHWTPDIRDFGDPVQERTWQLAGLDDLNTENAAVRRALRDSYGYWIREVGVDAFRVDTAFYVPPEFFRDFLHAEEVRAPGVLRVARATGREGFLLFGEGFGIDRPFEDAQARKIESYASAGDGTALLPGMINFPLYGSLLDVLARGRPPAVLGHRIATMMRVHARPHLMPSFVDNHDVDRFLAGGGEAALKQALLAIMALPGIPVIYYGTEQGFTTPRAAMFADGYGTRGDAFDTGAPLYRYLQRLIAARRAHPVLSRGVPSVLAAEAAGAGALAWRMRDGAATALVALNTAPHESLVAVDTGLPAGTVLRSAFAIDGNDAALAVGTGGRLAFALAADGGQVWLATDRIVAVPGGSAQIRIDAPRRAADGRLHVGGTASGVDAFVLATDGNLAAAPTVRPAADGTWQAQVDTGGMTDAPVDHSLVAWSAGAQIASPPRRFRVERAWTLLAERTDPAGDDTGPTGRYRYPTDPGWGERRLLDLRGARVDGAGGSLRVTLRMNAVAAQWNPPNGFDHAAFAIYVQLPERDGGADVLPQQNARLPAGMRWHYRLRAGGWATALFAAEDADAEREGTPIAGAVDVRVDTAVNTIAFTVPAAALGRPASLSGANIYVTIWDYDGGWRALAPEPGAYTFGGGQAGDPRIMDDLLIEIP